jgi:hypothetical protein
MIRTLVATGVFAAAGFAGVAAAPAASADPVCVAVTADTISTSPVTASTPCVPYSGASECADPFFVFDPWLGVWTLECVPAP